MLCGRKDPAGRYTCPEWLRVSDVDGQLWYESLRHGFARDRRANENTPTIGSPGYDPGYLLGRNRGRIKRVAEGRRLQLPVDLTCPQGHINQFSDVLPSSPQSEAGA